jgi:hypothetical protein
MQQAYNSLESEIEKHKYQSLINQKEMLNKVSLLTQLNNLKTSLQNQNLQNQIAQKDLLSKLKQEELKLKQEVFDKQNIERQRQELLIEIEKEKKENINLKSQYDTNTHNFKNQLEEKQKQLAQMESKFEIDRQTIFEVLNPFNINNDKDSDDIVVMNPIEN